MIRQLYAAVIKQPDQDDGYYRGIMAFVTHDLLNIVCHAASLETDEDRANWAFLSLQDGGSVAVLDVRAGGLVRGQKVLTQPFHQQLRDQLADYRAALLGGMRSSDSREMVEIPNTVAHGVPAGEMIDLQAARDAANPPPVEESKPDKKSKRA